MIGWYILAAILLLLLFLAWLRIRISVIYTDDITVLLQVLWIKIPLYPRKKKVKIHQYTYQKYRKRLLKQRKCEKEKRQLAAQSKPPKAKKRPRSLRKNLTLYQYLFQKLYARFLRHFRIDVAKLHITVATGDAAQTAILTGFATQIVAYLLAFLDQHTNLRHGYRKDISVTSDFLSDKSRISCQICFSLRIFEITGLGIRFFYHYLIGQYLRTTNKNQEDKPWQTVS